MPVSPVADRPTTRFAEASEDFYKAAEAVFQQNANSSKLDPDDLVRVLLQSAHALLASDTAGMHAIPSSSHDSTLLFKLGAKEVQ